MRKFLLLLGVLFLCISNTYASYFSEQQIDEIDLRIDLAFTRLFDVSPDYYASSSNSTRQIFSHIESLRQQRIIGNSLKIVHDSKNIKTLLQVRTRISNIKKQYTGKQLALLELIEERIDKYYEELVLVGNYIYFFENSYDIFRSNISSGTITEDALTYEKEIYFNFQKFYDWIQDEYFLTESGWIDEKYWRISIAPNLPILKKINIRTYEVSNVDVDYSQLDEEYFTIRNDNILSSPHVNGAPYFTVDSYNSGGDYIVISDTSIISKLGEQPIKHIYFKISIGNQSIYDIEKAHSRSKNYINHKYLISPIGSCLGNYQDFSYADNKREVVMHMNYGININEYILETGDCKKQSLGFLKDFYPDLDKTESEIYLKIFFNDYLEGKY